FSTRVFCDFGNSRVKIRYRHQTVTYPYEQDPAWELPVATILASLPSPLLLCIATVAPQRSQQLLRALQHHSVECLLCWLPELLPPTNPFLPYEGVHGIGIDRILGLIAAQRLFEPPIITVDCGTAITVNVLSTDGKCIGGAIFASVPLQLWALSAGTAALPALASPDIPPPSIGKTTEEALLSGTFASVLGGIWELIDLFSHMLKSPRPPAIVITGGGGLPFISILRRRWRGKLAYRPYLVLEGIEGLMERISDEQLQAHVQPLHAMSL
ncbi:MAG: type III pantothenate kinase, partial [Candidatus Kapabacteria bacterium]|nr:type III pantothenate kinase [Candidatus Kapabacteria bacterium]MDW7996553.1 type III pantothenate kinase [Bacteroidota bacterium]